MCIQMYGLSEDKKEGWQIQLKRNLGALRFRKLKARHLKLTI